MSKNNTVLNSTERSEAQFLTCLAAALSNYDLSGKIFRKFGPHLFSPAKHLYYILGDQAAKMTNKKIIDKTPYDIQPVRDKYEIAAHREQLLHKVKDEIFHRQK